MASHIYAIGGWHHTFTPMRGGIVPQGGGETHSGRRQSNALDLEGGQGLACLAVPCLVFASHISLGAGRLSFPCFTSSPDTFCPWLLWFVLAWLAMLCAFAQSHRVDNCGFQVGVLVLLPATPSI